ncbi:MULTISPECIES: glycosyltransferase [Kamptonema]|uniref:glycosyltransferase n=1 Tax=Kamptonema TaxID=1501433 RepID=UPI0001DAD51A|nr:MULTISPECIES: glycosyltransferase [Kamptonema]CBN58338.1 putative Glycosyl transferase, family 2 [Kamptonema sp. PCC 6506]
MNKLPPIDIVICTYNNALLLNKALLALSQQQVSPEVEWRVLIVDNNCTDNTQEVIEKYRVSGTIPHLSTGSETQQGLTYARHYGVQNTTADWIAFVDDDCFLAEDWVEQAVKFAATHPDCGAFGGRVILDWENPPPKYVLNYGYSFAQQEHGTEPQKKSCLVGAGLVLNRAALTHTGWIDKPLLHDRIGTKLISGGDVEIALRIYGAGYDLWYTPDCKLKHFIPARRTSQQYLIDINYGLGTSQVLGDSLLWSGSYRDWLLKFIWDAVKASQNIVIQSLRAALGRMNPAEVEINKSFVRGKWAGINRMIRMSPEERSSLLGRAKLVV